MAAVGRGLASGEPARERPLSVYCVEKLEYQEKQVFRPSPGYYDDQDQGAADKPYGALC